MNVGDSECKFGLMEPSMKDTGLPIKLKEREPFGMLKEMFIQVTLRMIKLMGTGLTLMSTAQNMKGTGRMTCKMDMAVKYGQMVPSIQGTTKKAGSMDMGYMNGSMKANTKAIG